MGQIKGFPLRIAVCSLLRSKLATSGGVNSGEIVTYEWSDSTFLNDSFCTPTAVICQARDDFFILFFLLAFNSIYSISPSLFVFIHPQFSHGPSGFLSNWGSNQTQLKYTIKKKQTGGSDVKQRLWETEGQASLRLMTGGQTVLTVYKSLKGLKSTTLLRGSVALRKPLVVGGLNSLV